MKSFSFHGIEIIKNKICSKELKEMGRNKTNNFIRKRKMGFVDLIYYNLNKKGLCTNMEINNFFSKTGRDITLSNQSLFDQRLKLNPVVFTELNKSYLTSFYKEFKPNVKTYKGYILKAIDGSDLEIPNTKNSKEIYGIAKGNGIGGVARASASVLYDLLNCYVIDGIIDRFRTSEIDMAISHMENSVEITNDYPSIYIMDRNYVSLSFMSYMIKNNIKFLARLKAFSHYMKETSCMTTNDEIVEIAHTKHRLQKSRFNNEEIRNYAKSKKSTGVRIIKHELHTGEIEYLISNIEDFTYNEIVSLYEIRWGIETLYYSLKSKLQIEKFTSSSKVIIQQDYFASILVYNMVQSFKNEASEKIEQRKYKYEMKINENISIGLFKNEMIYIFLESDDDKRMEKYDKLAEKILKYKIPVRKNRRFDVTFKTDNKNSYNKLKSF